MDIVVEVRSLGGKSEFFSVHGKDNIEALKRKIESSWVVPTYRQTLVCEGKVLPDTAILGNYHSQSKSRIIVFLAVVPRFIKVEIAIPENTYPNYEFLDNNKRFRRFMGVEPVERVVSTPEDSPHIFESLDTESVESVKRRIERKLKIPMSRQQLLLRGNKMDDNRKLGDYHYLRSSSPMKVDLEIVVQVTVKRPDASEPSKFAVWGSELIYTLKRQIFDRLGIEIKDQTLVYCGTSMKNDQCIKDYEIEHGSTLELLTKDIIYPMHLNIVSTLGKSFGLVALRSDTVARLRLRIEETANVSGPWRLVYAGKVLDNNSLLSRYGIHDGVTLNIVPRLQPQKNLQSAYGSVRVKLPTGSIIEVRSGVTQRVNDLKQIIEERCQEDRSRQRLLFGDTVLDGNVRIQDLGIDNPIDLELRPIPNAPYNISILIPGKPLVQLEVIFCDTVGYVKSKVMIQRGLAAGDYVLRFQHIDLADSNTLGNCLVGPSDILQLIPVNRSNCLEIDAEMPFLGDPASSHRFRGGVGDTVLKLKSIVSEKSLVPAEELEISFGGQILEDEQTIGIYPLHLSRKLVLEVTRGWLVDVNVNGSRMGLSVFILRLKENSTIEKLKRKIAATYRLRCEFDIVLRDRVLRDDVLLSQAGFPLLEVQVKPLAMAQEYAGEDYPHLHLLPHLAKDLLEGRWRDLLPLLPEFLRWDVEYKSCWTFTPSSVVSHDDIPYSIAGAPVVLPVNYRYPLTGPVTPPPDPHPQIINPSATLNIETIYAIFKDFQDALGFFLLINGMLQIMVPEGFDYEWASSHRPNVFGGLKICYISLSLVPTVVSSSTYLQATATSSDSKGRSSFRESFFRSQGGPSKTPMPALKLSQSVQARVKGVRTTEKHAGRIGVLTECNSRTYLTMSSHVITSAVFAKERSSIFSNWRNSSRALSNETWTNKAEIYANDSKVKNLMSYSPSMLTS
jgi:hypothetical protein